MNEDRSHPTKQSKYRSFYYQTVTSATTESSSQTSTEYSEDAQEQAAVSDEVNEDDFPTVSLNDWSLALVGPKIKSSAKSRKKI